MTKEELIEQLASAAYAWLNDADERPWEAALEGSRQNYRTVISLDFMPLIVQLVAAWLDERESYVADVWREDMA